jgi:hypothetical protein
LFVKFGETFILDFFHSLGSSMPMGLCFFILNNYFIFFKN